MTEIFLLDFMQRALVAGFLLGAITGFFGVFVVQRKMSFLGSGISHAAFGGVALGLLLNVEPMLAAIPFSLAIAFLIIYLKNKTNLGSDTTIGILFSVAMALGVIFLAIKEGYSSDAYSYLFGSILSVFPSDLMIISAIALLVIFVAIRYWKRWAYSTFDRELALSDKVPVAIDEYIMTLTITLIIVVSIKIVGMLLLGAYLIIPAATARLISRTFFQMTVVSVIIGALSSVVGLVLSYIVDMPSGAVIIIFQVLLLITAALFGKISK